MVLSKREKAMAAGLGVFVVLMILYFIISQMAGYKDNLTAEISRKQVILNQVKIYEGKIKKYAKHPSRKRNNKQSLISLIEQLANQSSLKDRIQLNRVPIDKSKGVEGIDIKLSELSLDEMAQFIFLIENTKPTLVIEQMEITSSFRSKDQLRLSLRVLAQT